MAQHGPNSNSLLSGGSASLPRSRLLHSPGCRTDARVDPTANTGTLPLPGRAGNRAGFCRVFTPPSPPTDPPTNGPWSFFRGSPPHPRNPPPLSPQRIPPTSPANHSPDSSQRELITLGAPRPGTARIRNEYIETPLRTCGQGPNAVKKHHSEVDYPTPAASPRWGTQSLVTHDSHRSHLTLPILSSSSPHNPSSPVTTQPTNVVHSHHHHHKKDQSDSQSGGSGSSPSGLGSDTSECHEEPQLAAITQGESIVCGRCGGCKCDACRTPRTLPSTWICRDKYLCSAETTLDYVSCMCCVKGIFYHYTKDYDIDRVEAGLTTCADNPCSCTGDHWWQRWACIGALSLVLPCLCFYWPLKAGMKLGEACYARHQNRGCRCRNSSNLGITVLRPSTTSLSTDSGHEGSSPNSRDIAVLTIPREKRNIQTSKSDSGGVVSKRLLEC